MFKKVSVAVLALCLIVQSSAQSIVAGRYYATAPVAAVAPAVPSPIAAHPVGPALAPPAVPVAAPPVGPPPPVPAPAFAPVAPALYPAIPAAAPAVLPAAPAYAAPAFAPGFGYAGFGPFGSNKEARAPTENNSTEAEGTTTSTTSAPAQE
ncbi:unnamed protein product [Bursaphelenchus okinawaensis]|uniref:Uncharacterized protein n=1 Tax=Bursaphelenchus okinawaensis TaxID=465554 RepID=A0A811L4L0_9BILA|nr:unnamed protein product [Bursaphelenchus okinawaensis]CAG9116589.1 unnamed protein product [Bursaphelenchus okinawaensis]